MQLMLLEALKPRYEMKIVCKAVLELACLADAVCVVVALCFGRRLHRDFSFWIIVSDQCRPWSQVVTKRSSQSDKRQVGSCGSLRLFPRTESRNGEAARQASRRSRTSTLGGTSPRRIRDDDHRHRSRTTSLTGPLTTHRHHEDLRRHLLRPQDLPRQGMRLSSSFLTISEAQTERRWSLRGMGWSSMRDCTVRMVWDSDTTCCRYRLKRWDDMAMWETLDRKIRDWIWTWGAIL